MRPRDSRGRFVSEREHAATFLLEVALADARKRIARGDWIKARDYRGRVVVAWKKVDLDAIADRLAEATRCADLLLAGEAS